MLFYLNLLKVTESKIQYTDSLNFKLIHLLTFLQPWATPDELIPGLFTIYPPFFPCTPPSLTSYNVPPSRCPSPPLFSISQSLSVSSSSRLHIPYCPAFSASNYTLFRPSSPPLLPFPLPSLPSPPFAL